MYVGNRLAAGAIHAAARMSEFWVAGWGSPRRVDQLLLVSEFLSPLCVTLRPDEAEGVWGSASS